MHAMALVNPGEPLRSFGLPRGQVLIEVDDLRYGRIEGAAVPLP